ETLAPLAAVHLTLAETPRRQGEIDAALAHGLVQVDRRRRTVVLRNVEWRAVRKHTPRARDRQLTDAELRTVELELRESPAVAAQAPRGTLDVGLEIPVVLLEMVGLQEQPLGPDDFILPRHRLPKSSRFESRDLILLRSQTSRSCRRPGSGACCCGT